MLAKMRGQVQWQEGPARCARPAWWLLYATGAALGATMGLVEMLVDGAGPREVLEGVTVLAGFVLIGIWLRVSRARLEMDQGRLRP